MNVTRLDPAIRDRRPNPSHLDIWTDVPTGIVLGYAERNYFIQSPNGQFHPVVFIPPQLVLPIGV